MNLPTRRTRLDYFVTSYEPLPGGDTTRERIYRRVNAASMSPDDPVALTIAADTIFEARLLQAVKIFRQLIAEVQKNTESFDESVRDALRRMAAELGDHVAGRVIASLNRQMPRPATGPRLRTVAALVIVSCFALGGAAWLGYKVGRADTAHIATEYAELARAPDAPTWRMLQRSNDNVAHIIAKHCNEESRFFITSKSGRLACGVPMWIEPGPKTAPLPPLTGFERLRAAIGRIVALWPL